MEFKEEIKEEFAKAIRISACNDSCEEIGWAYLYILGDDSHKKKYGFFADVFIKPEFRGGGNGTKLVKEIIRTAKEKGCYKLLCTSRDSRGIVEWYQKLGMRKHSNGFRIDFCDGEGSLK